MALDFPTSPTNGQIYDNYYWDNTNSVWRLLSDSLEVPANFSNTATGTYTSGFDYKYVSFTTDGVLTVTRGGYADILLVGGGGGGGQAVTLTYGVMGQGGGGAGGVLYIENVYLPAGSLDVVVGAGGLGGDITISTGEPYHAVAGNNGLPSSLWKYYVPGGGGGGASSQRGDAVEQSFSYRGFNGASGGGASGSYNTAQAVVPGGFGVSGIGNNGGSVTSIDNAAHAGGGGGGAGAAGGNVAQSGSTSIGGNGGAGVSNSITGSAVTYGGGGGGSANTAGGGTNGTGGAGGGGNAGNPPGDGTANTGGGGGASSAHSVRGGNGGSGIVIVRVRTN